MHVVCPENSRFVHSKGNMPRAGIWKFSMCRLLKCKKHQTNYQVHSVWHFGHDCASICNSFCKKAAGCTPARNHNNSNSQHLRPNRIQLKNGSDKAWWKPHVYHDQRDAPHIVQPHPSPQAACFTTARCVTNCGRKDRRSQWLQKKKKGVQCQPWIPKPESCDWITLFRGSIQLFQSCFNHFERITNLCTKRCWSRLDNTKSKHFTNDPASTSFVPSPNASPSPICIMANVTAKLWYYHVLCPWSRNWFEKLWLSKPIMSNLNDGIFGFPCCLWIHPFVPNWLTCWT